MLIAQLSDLHIKANGKLAYGVVDTVTMAERCVGALLAQTPRPDCVVITGDLVDFGRADEYAILASILAPLDLPIYLVAGNHDERAQLRRTFGGPRFGYLSQCDEFLQYAVDLGEIRLIVLDTVVPFEGRGQLCERRLAWLDQRLQEDDRPTVLAMHHPPFACGIGHMDAQGLEGADRLEAIVRRHPHVERILCGHLHRPIQVRFGNTLASTCPSPAHQVALDLRADAPDCFAMEPPAYQLHLWHTGRLISHTAVVGSYPGPYPFRRNGELID